MVVSVEDSESVEEEDRLGWGECGSAAYRGGLEFSWSP